MKRFDYDRIRYSPVGKLWWRTFLSTLLSGGAVFAIISLFLFFFIISIGMNGWVVLILYVGVIALAAYKALIKHVRSFEILSQMSDAEFEDLLSEYKQYESRNITTFGILTEYGIVLDEGIAPWQYITVIEFLPVKYVHTKHGTRQIPPRMLVHVSYGRTRRATFTQSLESSFDLSGEIARFTDSFSDFTEYRYEIHNEYYFES